MALDRRIRIEWNHGGGVNDFGEYVPDDWQPLASVWRNVRRKAASTL